VSKRAVRVIAILIAIPIVLCLCIQLIPVWLAQKNPPVVAEPKWDSPQTRALAKRVCFDCHSNETVWPAYARVAPISWLVTLDTIRGRRHLNFSEWGQTRGEGTREMDEVINQGSMPPAIYVLMHPSSKLSQSEQQQLIKGLQASLR
jgi:cytochrome c551/c552